LPDFSRRQKQRCQDDTPALRSAAPASGGFGGAIVGHGHEFRQRLVDEGALNRSGHLKTNSYRCKESENV
jgi:hypothetical protein